MNVDGKKPGIEVKLLVVFLVIWNFLFISDISKEIKLLTGLLLIIWSLVVAYRNRRTFLELNLKHKMFLGFMITIMIIGVVYNRIENENHKNMFAASGILKNIGQINSAEVYDYSTDTLVVYDDQEDIQEFVKPFSNPIVSWKPDRSIKEGLGLLYTITIDSSIEWIVSNDIDLVFEVYESDEEVFQDSERISFKVDDKHYVLLFKDHICTLYVVGSGREVEASDWRNNVPYSIRESMGLALDKTDVTGRFCQPDDLGLYEEDDYYIYHREDGTNTVALINRDTGRLHHLYNFHASLKENSFDSIEIGSSRVDDVRAIDEFLFLVEKGDNIAFSEHLIEGGNALIIEYELIDSDWVVSDKRVKKDDSGMATFIENLLGIGAKRASRGKQWFIGWKVGIIGYSMFPN